jgi:SAM-dependent methyltransferase
MSSVNGNRKVLDVGCGLNKQPGAIGLDISPKTDADVIHDLGDIPYPFADSEFDEVIANHVIEHVPDVMKFMCELYRITRSGGRIRLLAPHYTNPDWPTDPTHRNHLNCYSFNCFMDDPGKRLFPFYTDIRLKPKRVYVTLANLWRAMGLQTVVNLDQRWPAMRFTRKMWEHYLSFIVRGKEIQFEFEVCKPGDQYTGRL